jgi:hypothetical protein
VTRRRLPVRRTVDDHLLVLEDDRVPPHIDIAEAMRHDLPWDAPDLDEALDAAGGEPVEVVVLTSPPDPAGRATTLTVDLLARRAARGCTDDAVVRSEG